MDNLDKDLIRMRQLGYGANYGKYKTDFPNTKSVEAICPQEAPNRTCAYCGKVFFAAHRSKKYCSEECARKEGNRRYWNSTYKRRGTLTAICATCGATFNPGDPRVKYCSADCKKEVRRRYERMWRARKKEETNE